MTKELLAKDIKKLTPELLYAPAPEASHLVVACRRRAYSAARMAHAAEDVDAHVLNLNVTAVAPEGLDDYVLVALRVARRDASAVARSLERYGYSVLDFSGDADCSAADADEPDARERLRVAELLRYLEM